LEQDKQADQLTNGVFILVAIGDTGVRCIGGMVTQEVMIVCDQHSLVGSGEGEVLSVGGAQKAGIRGRGHIDATLP
jgi:hypothetical protein